ncbi:MAG: MFS transporter [Promethearchaeota archaeon]
MTSETNTIVREKSTTRKFILFALPKYSNSIVMGFADLALATLYILAYQLPPFLVGLALGLGKITIAISQFFFGWISDAKYTRLGRRKPYIILLAPILGISFILLLLPSMLIDITNIEALFIWLLVIYQFFNMSYAITTPFNAWMVEQFSVEERPKAAQIQTAFDILGVATISVFSLIIMTDFISKVRENPEILPPSFFYSVIAFGIMVIVVFYLVCFLMPIEPHFKIESTIFQYLKVVLKNKKFIAVIGMIGIASLGWVQVSSLVLLFIEVVLKFEFTTYIMASVVFILGIILFLYMWRTFIKKFGKKRTLMYDLIAAVIFLPFTLIGLIPMQSTLIYGIIFVLGIAAIYSGWQILQYIMIPDISEDDEKATGELKAGTYKGIPSIPLNFFQAIGLIIMGSILELPEISVGSSSFSIGYVLWGPICSAILLITLFYAKKYITLDFEWEKKD